MQGCCIKTGSVAFRVGSHVLIRPDSMEPLGGTVRWIAGDCAGVEFDRPIYGPILEHLVRMHEAGVSVEVARD